ncbi:MAG: hypothetical protein Q9174_003024 [Haloplaca sp. 1 TL-2023]
MEESLPKRLSGGNVFPGSSRSFGVTDAHFAPDAGDEIASFTAAKSDQHAMSKQNRRTILLKNLPDRATHKDIVGEIYGGLLLDVFLRPQDKSASVSFVETDAAEDFLAHVKRNDLYIHGRRVSCSWSERQFFMPGHVANKISRGATRNLVLRNISPTVTEDRLRDDLDHIHNLVVISISFRSGDAYLSLNSIHNSLFARTCMMSRATYKGMKIEWYPDECARPLPQRKISNPKQGVPLPKAKAGPMMNRFQMLNMDDEDASDAGSSLDEDEDLTMTTGFSRFETSRRSQYMPTVAA